MARYSPREVNEIIEDRREFDFKRLALGQIVEFLLTKADNATRQHVGAAMFRLALGHTRAEPQLKWSFEGFNVIAAERGTRGRAFLVPYVLDESPRSLTTA